MRKESMRLNQIPSPRRVFGEFWAWSRQKTAALGQSGATAIEYGIIAAFVAISIYLGAVVAGNGVRDIFWSMGNKMNESVDH
jgi:Flp pilus assembly pilin Flp